MENTPEALIQSTFEKVTFFTAPCLPGVSLCLDAPDVEENDSDLPEFTEAFSRFLLLQPEDLHKAALQVFAQFKEYEAVTDPACLDVVISEENEVWSELDFKDANLVRSRYGTKEIYVQLAAECSWDPEHGIQFVFNSSAQLIRVSEQDGYYED